MFRKIMMKCNEYPKRLLCIVMITAVLFSMPFFSVPVTAAEEVVAADTVRSVSIVENGDKIEVLATLTDFYVSKYQNDPVYLFELSPSQDVTKLADYEPVKTFRPSAKLSCILDIFSGTRSRLTSRFILAQKNYDGSYVPMGNACYISNPEVLAQSSAAYPVSYSKKGLIFSDISDAEQLGISHTVIDIPLNEYFLGESSESAVSYLYNGKTFYFSRSLINDLDIRIRSLSNAGVNVYLRIVLSPREKCGFDGLLSLYYPDAPEGDEYYAPNINDPTGCSYFEAFMKFISSRYSASDRQFGFAGSYIIGYEANVNKSSNSMGEKDLKEYAKEYASLFRTAYLCVRSAYSNARLYVPVANNFTAVSPSPGSDSTDLAGYSYPAKSFLSEFNSVITKVGNIPWKVAVNAYSSDRSNPTPWIDSLCENNLETPYISVFNSDILCRFLSQTEFLYGGEIRSICISSFGIAETDPDENSTVTSEAAEKKQAAAYAYAYYIIAANGGIEAAVYGHQTDSSGNGPRYGIWTLSSGSETLHGSKKYIYEIFKSIDTKPVSPFSDFALGIIGTESFEGIITGLASVSPSKSVYEAVMTPVVDIEKGYTRTVLFDLTEGSAGGFMPAENSRYTEMRGGADEDSSVLYVSLDPSAPYEYMGMDVTAKKAFFAGDNAEFITVRLMADAPSDVSGISFMLRLYGADDKNAYSYEGTAQIEPGKWTELTFAVDEYLKLTSGSFRNLKVWIRPSDEREHDGGFGLYLENISVWNKKSMSVFA
ncbi:MAG: hypothetical protein J5933_07585, partial [Clostridia bacterium]|nr:hypothetical protein [Clostridia bacterium]